MSSPIFMTRESQYLWIKQRLDSLNISTTFPLQAMPLLQTLLSKLSARQSTPATSHSSIQQPYTPHDLAYKHVDSALRHQLQQIVHENNTLHLQLITQTQQVQSLRHCLDKLAIEKGDPSNKEELRQILQFRNDHEQQLGEELKVAKFRYNQLVDWVMAEDGLEKMYIKRLVNHKKYADNVEKDRLHKDSDSREGSHVNQKQQDLNSRITFNKATTNSSSRQKESRKRINKTTDHLQNPHTSHHNPSSPSHQTITHLRTKLLNRQNQITRLQGVISHDGPNLTRVLTQFDHQMKHKQYNQMHERIELLEKENHRITQELRKVKSTGGRYQALRDQVQKCHQVIMKLKEENGEIRRMQKHREFDLEAEKKGMDRNVQLYQEKNIEMKVNKYSDDLTIEDLRRKVQFYEKQLENRNKHLVEEMGHQLKDQSKQKPFAKNPLKSKKSSTSKPIESQKKEPNKIKLTIQAKQKQEELLKEQSLKKGPVKKATKNSKQSIKVTVNQKNTINQIPQVSEEQQNSSYIKQPQKCQVQYQGLQYQQNVDILKKNQQKNPLHDQQSSSQSQEQQESSSSHSQSQSRNQTLIQQYEQTISELSTKCLQLKQELELKNDAMKGMEDIANRLMRTEQERNVNQLFDQQPSHEKPQQSTSQLSHLHHQISNLSSLLNESEFQKQELRRQVIQLQTLYKKINTKNEKSITSQQQLNSQNQQRLSQLQAIIDQKDKKIDDMREDNVNIQDKLLKALDRIRRLNDQIEVLIKEKNGLVKEMEINQERMDQAGQLLREQRERHSGVIGLSEVEKDQIIGLRRNLNLAEKKIEQLEELIDALKEHNQRLVEQFQ